MPGSVIVPDKLPPSLAHKGAESSKQTSIRCNVLTSFLTSRFPCQVFPGTPRAMPLDRTENIPELWISSARRRSTAADIGPARSILRKRHAAVNQNLQLSCKLLRALCAGLRQRTLWGTVANPVYSRPHRVTLKKNKRFLQAIRFEGRRKIDGERSNGAHIVNPGRTHSLSTKYGKSVANQAC